MPSGTGPAAMDVTVQRTEGIVSGEAGGEGLLSATI